MQDLVHVLDARLHAEHVAVIVELDVQLHVPIDAEAAVIPLVLLHAKVVVVIVPMVVDQVVLAGAVQHVIHVLMGAVHVEVHAPTVVLVAAVKDVIVAVAAIQVVIVLVLVLVLVDVVAIAVGSVLHAMDVLTVAVATERVLLVVTHPAMRAHIQWCESPEKERSGSLSRGGRVPDFYG